MHYRVVTLTQPWATLIAVGAKHIETRSWATSYRGPLLIHAAAGLGPVGGRAGLYDLAFSDPDGYFYQVLKKVNIFCIDDLPRGAIVARCNLLDCVWIGHEWPDNQLVSQATQHRLTDQERAFGDYTPGRYAWLLADVRRIPRPIPAKGALGLWVWNGELPS